MPTDRFLIRFDTNVTAAMAALDRLAAKVTQIEARLNALGAKATSAASFSGISQGATQAQASVAGLSASAQQATRHLEAIKAGDRPIRQVGSAATSAATALGALNTRAQVNLELFNQFGNVAAGRRAMSMFQQIAATQTVMGTSAAKATQQANALHTALSRIPGGLTPIQRGLGVTDNSFARHIRRIEETIFAYAAFFAAANALRASFDLATTVERESRRLEAVLDIDPTAAQGVISGLADVAVETVTPVENLVSEMDFMASAFSNIEDPAKRAASALELANLVGKVTTVTQRDVATETENVISIMKQANIPIDQMGDALGKIVVAGGQSSTAIRNILDALQQSTAAASLAGVDFDELVAIIGRFRDITQRSGSEIGNTLKTLFQTITGTEAQNNLEELTDGMVKVKDEAGNIRDVTDIMADLVAVTERFPSIADRLPNIFKALAPPLQPGAARDLQILFDIFKDLGPALDEVASASEISLNRLVDQINSALGPQFLKFIEEIKRGFLDLFGPELIEAGKSILGVITTIRDALAKIPEPILLVVAQFAAFFGVVRAGSFILRGLVALLGFGGVATATAAAARGAGTLTAALAGLSAVAGKLLPVLIAFAALEFASGAIEESDRISALREELGLTADAAEAAVHGKTTTLKPFIAPGTEFGGFSVDDDAESALLEQLGARFGVGRGGIPKRGPNIENQLQNVSNLGAALHQLNAAGQLTPEIQAKMEEAVKRANIQMGGSIKTVDQLIAAGLQLDETTEGITSEYERYLESIEQRLAAESELSAQQRIQNEASEIQLGLAKEMADAFEDLSDRLRDGDISFEEYTAGVEQVNRASELASQLVAAASNELAKVPQLAGAAAEGQDALAAAIFRMITSSTDQLPAIDQLISKIVGIAGAAAAAAATAAANPILIKTIILPPERVAAGGGIPEGAGDPGLGKPGGSFTRPFILPGLNISQINQQVQSLINSLIGQLVGGTSGTFGIGPSGGGSAGRAAARRQTDVLDIGDLRRKDISQIIAIATKLRDKIPGARADSADAVVALIKDAQFLRTIRGIDDRLLRLAIEQLTDVERQRLEEERKKNAANEILRSLQVNAGPTGVLISQPNLFGVGGSIPAGLNFDPERGSFVVNIDFSNFGTLSERELQQRIYETISRAIRDGLRLQGSAV